MNHDCNPGCDYYLNPDRWHHVTAPRQFQFHIYCKLYINNIVPLHSHLCSQTWLFLKHYKHYVVACWTEENYIEFLYWLPDSLLLCVIRHLCRLKKINLLENIVQSISVIDWLHHITVVRTSFHPRLALLLRIWLVSLVIIYEGNKCLTILKFLGMETENSF